MGSAWIGFRIALLPFWIALHEATFLAGANRLISGLPQGVLRFWWRIAFQRGNGSLDYAPGQTEVKHDLRLCGGRIGCALRVDGINNNVPSGAVEAVRLWHDSRNSAPRPLQAQINALDELDVAMTKAPGCANALRDGPSAGQRCLISLFARELQ